MEMKVNRILVKQLRDKKFWTQEKLAEMSNVHPRTIQRIEKDGIISIQTRVSVCKALGIKPEELEIKTLDNPLLHFGRAVQNFFLAAFLAIFAMALIETLIAYFINSFRTVHQSFEISWLAISVVVALVGAALVRIAPTQSVRSAIILASFSVFLPLWDGMPPVYILRVTLVELLPLFMGCLAAKWWQYRKVMTNC